jgi:hypothetical protein
MTFDHDDRTPEQKATHRWAVAMTDSFMSGWGKAQGGASYAAWAIGPDDSINEAERWVRGRSDAKRVRVVDLNSWRPKAKHTSVYVWTPR